MKKLPLLFLVAGLICFLFLIYSIGLSALPGQVGVQEGGKVVILTAFGFSATSGLAVGVALRLNQVVLILLGLVALAVLNSSGVPVNDAAADDSQPVLNG